MGGRGGPGARNRPRAGARYRPGEQRDPGAAGGASRRGAAVRARATQPRRYLPAAGWLRQLRESDGGLMEGFSVFLRKEWREAVRSNRLLVVAAVFLVLGIISPLTAKYTPELLKAIGTGQPGVTITFPTPTVNDAIAQFIKNVAGT